MNTTQQNSTHKVAQTKGPHRFLVLSICITMALGYTMPILSLHGASRTRTNMHHQTHTNPTNNNNYAHVAEQSNQPQNTQSPDYRPDKPSIRIRIKNYIVQSVSSTWRTIRGFFWGEQQSYPHSYTQNYAQSHTPSYSPVYSSPQAPAYAQSYSPTYSHNYTYPNYQQSYQAQSNQKHNYHRPTTRTNSRTLARAQTQHRQQRATPNLTRQAHSSRHQLPQVPTAITHRFRQYQIQATNQRNNTCGLHAAANALSIERCLSMGHAITAATITQHQGTFYAQGAQFIGHTNNLTDNDIMRLVYTRFGINNCCVLSMDRNICYTTYQSAQDIEWGVPDYSGPAFDNNAIRAMLNNLKDNGAGAVHFICHINNNAEHWILISVIKEHNQYAIAYMDSQNRPLTQRPQAQRYINMLCEHYFTPILG